MMYVEDFLDLLAGNTECRHCESRWIISLANYDYNPVRNMANSVETGRGLSNKQRALAVKIVLKYQKQLAKHGYDVSLVETDPQWRSSIRHVDRSKKIYIQDEKICVKFPFSPDMVSFFRRYSNVRELRIETGTVEWSTEQKVWQLACTEKNIEVISNVTKNENFEYSAEFQTLVDQLDNIKNNKTKHIIMCSLNQNDVVIKNASLSLQEEYEKNKTGNFLHDVGIVKKLGVKHYSLSLLKKLYKINPLLCKLVMHRVFFFKNINQIHEIEKQLLLLGINVTFLNKDESSIDNFENLFLDCVYCKETFTGVKGRYVLQRAPIVLYCSNYFPIGHEEAYLLE